MTEQEEDRVRLARERLALLRDAQLLLFDDDRDVWLAKLARSVVEQALDGAESVESTTLSYNDVDLRSGLRSAVDKFAKLRAAADKNPSVLNAPLTLTSYLEEQGWDDLDAATLSRFAVAVSREYEATYAEPPVKHRGINSYIEADRAVFDRAYIAVVGALK